MNASESRQPYLDFPSLALTHERIAALRAEADRARLVRATRGPRRSASWPAGVVTALRDSIAGARPTPRSVTWRQPCPTC